MNPFSRAIVFVLVSGLAMLLVIQPSNACGPFSRYAIFSYTKHPDLPLDKFAGGDLGVLQTSYARSYLYVAYRLMDGGSFDKSEREALSALWNQRLDLLGTNENPEATPEWIEARTKVTGIGPQPRPEVFRTKSKDDYESFLNCTNDAFKNAAKTLEERIAKFGAGSSEVKEWTLAQDQVFSNCGGGPIIPDQTTSPDPIIKADRAYQIAAAHFYAMEFDDARTHFERISNDSSSQWHEQARYLVARSLIRKASLGDPANRQESLVQAETTLKSFLATSKNATLNQSAQGLLDLVELRLHPEMRLRELAETLRKKSSNLKQDLLDYTVLLDRYTGDSDQTLDENLKKAVDAGSKDDLTEWLLMFQSQDESALARSLEMWEKTRSRPWLIACLSKIDSKNSKAQTLMAEAAAVEKGSPTFYTAQFHMIRLLIEKGDRVVAGRSLEEILQSEATMPPSTANQFRRQRMSDFNEFLKYALRRPAAFSWDEDGLETPIDVKDDDELKPWSGRALLDSDSTNLLNERFPLSLLRGAAANPILPEHIRRQIALAAWTRAMVLDDVEEGKQLASLAVVLAPELKAYLNPYQTATTREARQSAGLYAILKSPGLRPFLDSSFGRLTPIGERDIYRDNWWCDITPVITSSNETGDEAEDATQEDKRPAQPPVPVNLEFLKDSQAATAKREHAMLLALGSAPNYLAREAIDWAKRAPNDPRVPEALHLAVTSTRYGCTDKDSSKWSKAAFDLLHKRYPQSTWAKKTPYWFKDV